MDTPSVAEELLGCWAAPQWKLQGQGLTPEIRDTLSGWHRFGAGAAALDVDKGWDISAVFPSTPWQESVPADPADSAGLRELVQNPILSPVDPGQAAPPSLTAEMCPELRSGGLSKKGTVLFCCFSLAEITLILSQSCRNGLHPACSSAQEVPAGV